MDFATYAALVSEGQCPHGHGPLERRDDLGWCVECAFGYRVRMPSPDEEWMGDVIVDEVYVLEARPITVGRLTVTTAQLTRGAPEPTP